MGSARPGPDRPLRLGLRLTRSRTSGVRTPADTRTFEGRPGPVFSRAWHVSDGSHQLLLRPTGLLSRRLAALRDGVPVARIDPANGPGVYRPVLETSVDLPLEEVLFLMWLAHVNANWRGGGD